MSPDNSATSTVPTADEANAVADLAEITYKARFSSWRSLTGKAALLVAVIALMISGVIGTVVNGWYSVLFAIPTLVSGLVLELEIGAVRKNLRHRGPHSVLETSALLEQVRSNPLAKADELVRRSNDLTPDLTINRVRHHWATRLTQASVIIGVVALGLQALLQAVL